MKTNIKDLVVELGLAKSGEIDGTSLIISDLKEFRTSAEAIKWFRDFGGEGWFCATDSKEIRRFSVNSPLRPISPEAWPIAAESAKNDMSLHLLRTAEGWKLTTLKRVPADGDSSIVLLTHTLKAKDGQGDLCYEVAWKPDDVAGLNELHPYAFRFVGFKSY
jgi:hypothetical protein